MNTKAKERRAGAAVFFLCALCAMFGAWPAAAQDDRGDSYWPRQLDGEMGTIILYQPQIESYANNVLEARAALSVTRKGQSEPAFGAAWFKAWLLTDLDTRIATLENVEVTAAKFPTIDDAQVAQLAAYLERELPQWDLELNIDDLLAGLDATEAQVRIAEQLNNDPPEIIFVTHPAVLVLIDGEPILSDMEGYDLKYVANTAFFVVQDKRSKHYYLKGGDIWYTAPGLTREWAATKDLPADVQKVARAVAEEQARQEKQAGVAPSKGDDGVGDSPIPEIIVRTEPAELVQTDGDMKFVPLDGTQLLYVENTETDILMDLASQQYYILLSGRWYRSKSMTGGRWEFVNPGDLPADFANIHADSDMGQVLASVPGTQESKEAVLENQIPQTAEIDRKTATVEVRYDGDPKFKKCSDAVAYALNTDKAVLLVGGTYYCCDQAVWFVSNGPSGPWQVATSVPPEIQDVPPDCPHYNVKYVYIYDSTPDVVYVGYTPGYASSYVYYGTVVYGTGYWYRPWYHYYYYPRPVTWGFHAHWNPVTGWGMSFGVSYGWLHISVGRPWYGGWWGPCGYSYGYRHGYHRGYHHGYHHGARAGYRAGYRAGQATAYRNVYKSRPTGVKTTGRPQAAPARTVRRTTPAQKTAPAQKKATKPTNRQNNHYADKNGNVYRKQGNDWQQKNKSGWSSSKGSKQNLNREQQTRQRGNQKAQKNKSAQRSPSRGGAKRRR